jgi:uncharacterized protein (TIGR03437 family)
MQAHTVPRLASILLFACSCDCLLAQLLYVPNQEGTISVFVANPRVGTLAEALPRLKIPGWPDAAAAEPAGKFLYVGFHASDGRGPSLAAYAINAATGALMGVSGSPYRVNGSVSDLKADPRGRFLYAALEGANNVAGYAVSAATGALTAITGSPFAAGNGPARLAITPSGRHLYVSNRYANSVSAFSVNETTGALTRVQGSPFATQAGPSGMATEAEGRFLYVTNQDRNTVSVFAIDSSTGALSPVAGSPFATGQGPDAAALTISGRFLIVSNGDDSTLSIYSVNPETGGLSAVPGSPVDVPRGPVDVAVDPSGKCVYVVSLLDNTVSGYLLDPESGLLTPAPGAPYAAGSGPKRAALVRTSPAIPPPVILRAASNAASLAKPELPNSGIARGSTFMLSGLNLGPAERLKATEFPLQESLGGTSVKVNVAGSTVNALVVSTYVTRVHAILPSNTPLGNGAVTVTYDGQTSAAVAVRVVDAAPGLFTRNEDGIGPAAARNQNSPEAQAENGFSAAAHPGQAVVLLATGLGPVADDETRPAAARNLRDDIEVWVGNRLAIPSYSGRSPEYPGVDHVIFTLPDDVPQGCYVPVALKIAGQPVVSNFASIAVAGEGSACTDPHTRAWAPSVDANSPKELRVGWLQFLRLNATATIPGLGSPSGMIDTAWAEFFRWNGDSAARDAGLDMFTGRGVSLGGCSVYSFEGRGPGWHPMRAAFLDGGAVLNTVAPKSKGSIVRTRAGFYEAHKALGVGGPPEIMDRPRPGPILEPGSIKVDNGAGGRDIGPFQATLTISGQTPALDWTNLAGISSAGVDRAAGLTFTWTGGDPETEYVVLAGAVLLPGNFEDDLRFAAAFVCTEKAAAGQFTVPEAVLQALPPSNEAEPLSGLLLVGRAPFLSSGLEFSAPGLDLGFLSYATYSGTTTVIR